MLKRKTIDFIKINSKKININTTDFKKVNYDKLFNLINKELD